MDPDQAGRLSCQAAAKSGREMCEATRLREIGSLVLALLMLALAIVTWPANAQDCVEGSYGCQHAEHHESYKTWRQPDRTDGDGITHRGMSCCEPMECRPVRAKQLPSGQWVWWNGSMWSDPVPPEAMLPTDLLGDGRTHACGPKPEYTGGRQITYCFSPGEVRM